MTTGRKLINQYEVIEEIGRGMHGKVKLARNLETGGSVAIKIIPRFSKKRRLGKVTAMSPQDKTKKEIAILKKIRHPNVVALLEVIDDPELKKIYMVLEHAEYGEIVWRKKGLPHICQYERRRVEREMHGEHRTPEEERYEQMLEQRQAVKEWKRAKMAQNFAGPVDYWSVEHGAADESGSSYGRHSRISSKEDFAISDGMPSRPSSRHHSRGPSRGPSRSQSVASVGMPMALPEPDDDYGWESEEMETPGPLRSNPNSATHLEGTMYGAYIEDNHYRGRRPSVADSIISHMSSVDYYPQTHDSFADDFSYVPCFGMDQARSVFRDTLLGLEYLHYQGVVHRDIKPANLLWCKGHRVKISDFGVSYFGRPIRDGEMGETVSESEAKDFDDDLELAKTVGTPAFFAPELCYTDVSGEQPKVSEQIDVWSLGVTLYCLIFARIPFLAEDEFQMFRKIATEEVYIPRRRLRPVDPATSPVTTSLYNRHATHPSYRNDNDLAYEEIDDQLHDLLRQMLTKNPEHRIRLRDIKRHKWVIQGVPNPIGWLDDTDPGRPSSGRKIQVNERDVSDAVVPLTFLERARSVVKKTIGKVIQPLVERSDSKPRRRAASSVASSSGDTSMFNGPPTTYARDERRRSLKPDEGFFETMREALASSKAAQADTLAYDPLATVLPPVNAQEQAQIDALEATRDSGFRPRHRHGHSLSKPTHQLFKRTSRNFESHTTPASPSYDGIREMHSGFLLDEVRNARKIELGDDETSRSRSVDRGLFGVPDKHASPILGLSHAVAPGDMARPVTPCHPRPMRSVDLVKAKNRTSVVSPLATSMAHTSNEAEDDEASQDVANGDVISQGARKHTKSNPESYARVQEALHNYRRHSCVPGLADASEVPCPPSDDDEWSHHPGAPSRGDTMTTVKSSSTESIDGLNTPLTAPSEVTSPVSAHPPKNDSHHTFHSDPSLPALLSGASSVSADMEAELLGRPGLVQMQPSLLETTDSLTPPAYEKEPTNGFPLDEVFSHPHAMMSGSVTLRVDHHRSESALADTGRGDLGSDDGDDEDDEGSDDGILLMAKSKRKSMAALTPSKPKGPFGARRRDTNISTTSIETAKPTNTGASDHGGDGDITPSADLD